MKENKIIILLITTLLLSRAWFVFSDEHQWIIDAWNIIGFDVSGKYSAWIFIDDVSEKPKWYGHDAGYILSFIILLRIILKAVPFSRNAYLTVSVFYYFAIFRIIEYCLFRFHIGFTYISWGIILFAVFFMNQRKCRT